MSIFFFSSRRRHTRFDCDWSSDVCSSDLCMQRIPFDPFSMAVDHRQFLFMPIYFLLVALPFFCSGLGISLLLTRLISFDPRVSNKEMPRPEQKKGKATKRK